LKDKVDVWHVATLTGPRGTSAEALATMIAGARLGGEIICHDSPQAAMQAAKGQAAESDRILAFGSFHTVAGALQALRGKP
jgi:dihydrofolate synthase/folylpolyglutamate synthase